MYEGLVNFRDFGGVPSLHGGVVRSGTLFRSGLFSFVGSEAGDHLVATLGVATVIDLRTERELSEHPTPPMFRRHPRLQRVHIPFFRGPELADLSLPRGYDLESWAMRYVGYTEVSGRYAIVRTFEQLLDGGAPPTVFHCWAGKDRTGLVAAALLDLLGVDDETIGDDYQRSMDWWLPRLDMDELAEGEPQAGYRTTAPVIKLALAKIRSRFGSVEKMLLGSDMAPDLPDRLRSSLLT